MTDELKAILQYRALLLCLFIIMSLSFLVIPMGISGYYLFRLSIGMTLIVIPIMTIVDLQELIRGEDEPK